MPLLNKHPHIPALRFSTECNWDDAEFIKFISYKRDDDSKDLAAEFEELYVYISLDGINSVWKRIKTAWYVIWHGKFENNGVLLGKEKLCELIKYLNEVVAYWNYLEEEDEKMSLPAIKDVV